MLRAKIKGAGMAGPQIVVLGNEKGGTGKSTTAVHIATALVASGVRVGAIDLDVRQRSLARYMENRAATARRTGTPLPAPETLIIGETEGEAGLAEALNGWAQGKEVIVIDTPGRHGPMIETVLGRADVLVTPLNDSFVDLDLLARVDPETWKVKAPSFYAELVWETRKRRARAEGVTVDWVVLRNRLAHLEARNMRRMASVMAELAKRIGFRVIPGLSERVIYRELFPSGLTLLDGVAGESATLSHVAARQELRELMAGLNLAAWSGAAKPAAAA
ncbi:MAG: division plane positioning ATPase MipZ [Sphingomonadaceae bacterium]|nr:division plane positioning ATPase MipZ [Sphingomonadaceae bacterium]